MQEQHVVMMSCKAKPGMSMAVKDGAVIFIGTSETDINQQWFKAYIAEGNPAFALVNLGTSQAIQNPEKAEQPVRLVPYTPANPLDPLKPNSLLWTAEDNTQNGFQIIHEFKGGNLVLSAAHQGLQVVVSNYNGGESRQLWSIQERI